MTRQVLLGLALICALLVISYGALFALYLGPRQSALTQVQDLQDQLADIDQRISNLRRDLPSGSSLSDVAALVASGHPVSETMASFQEQMRAEVTQGQGNTLSSQAVLTDLGGGYSKVSILLRARFDEMGLLRFLRMVEQQQPVILVDALSVRSLPVQGTNEKPLDVTATLTEFHSNAPAS